MKEVFVAMAVMGCGDGGTSCETLKIMQPDFRTVAECYDAAPDMLRGLSDLDYPEVQIDCDARKTLAARAKSERLG